ncbi:MAG: hypothetical protein JKY34_11300 [Kordiimonadaceae bacterium]|nr:hypothetical protein [Kordiimonadaceae bacterium]
MMAEHNQQFDTFIEWVNKAPSWLTRHTKYHERYFRAVCVDAAGRICCSGADMMRARDDSTFPVRWWWPDQAILELANSRPTVSGDKT